MSLTGQKEDPADLGSERGEGRGSTAGNPVRSVELTEAVSESESALFALQVRTNKEFTEGGSCILISPTSWNSVTHNNEDGGHRALTLVMARGGQLLMSIAGPLGLQFQHEHETVNTSLFFQPSLDFLAQTGRGVASSASYNK